MNIVMQTYSLFIDTYIYNFKNLCNLRGFIFTHEFPKYSQR